MFPILVIHVVWFQLTEFPMANTVNHLKSCSAYLIEFLYIIEREYQQKWHEILTLSGVIILECSLDGLDPMLAYRSVSCQNLLSCLFPTLCPSHPSSNSMKRIVHKEMDCPLDTKVSINTLFKRFGVNIQLQWKTVQWESHFCCTLTDWEENKVKSLFQFISAY